MDAPSREALERALLDYEGTIFAISHDRYLVNRLATRVLSLTPQGLDESIGNYDDYLRHQQERRLVVQNQANPAPAKAPSESKERRENAAALRRARAQLRKAEDTIERWEEQIHALEQQLAQPESACDYEPVSYTHLCPRTDLPSGARKRNCFCQRSIPLSSLQQSICAKWQNKTRL